MSVPSNCLFISLRSNIKIPSSQSGGVRSRDSDHVTRILRSYLDLVFLSSSSTLVCSNPGWFRRWFRAGGDYRNHIILAEYAGVWKLLEVGGSYPVGQAWWKKKAPAALACCAENIVVIEQWTKPLILVILKHLLNLQLSKRWDLLKKTIFLEKLTFWLLFVVSSGVSASASAPTPVPGSLVSGSVYVANWGFSWHIIFLFWFWNLLLLENLAGHRIKRLRI